MWVWCPLCDAFNRPYTHPEFDAETPQVHCAQLLLERAAGV